MPPHRRDLVSRSSDDSVLGTAIDNTPPGVDGNNTINVLRQDLASGATTLVSADSAGTGVGGAVALA